MTCDTQLVTNIIHEFMHLIDDYSLKNDDKFVFLFTNDAKFTFPERSIDRKGAEQLRLLYHSMGKALEGHMHLEHNIIQEFNQAGTECVNRSYWGAYRNGEMKSAGRHLDLIIKVDGTWKFKTRQVSLSFSA